MTTLKEMKAIRQAEAKAYRELKKQVFSSEKIFGDIVKLSDGRYFEIVPKFGRKYEDSRFYEISEDDLIEKKAEYEEIQSIAKSLVSFEKNFVIRQKICL